MASTKKNSRKVLPKNNDGKKQTIKSKDYTKLRRLAFEYIVIHGKDQKETSELTGVSEPTISKWGNEANPTWRDQRKARQQCFTTDTDNTKNIIRLLSESRLDLEMQIIQAKKDKNKEEELNLREQARGLSDEISKHNKTLMNLDKENKTTLGEYIYVMEDLFNAMRAFDEDLFLKCVDFQTQHIRKKMIELG